jgi:hypothetical protein
MSLLKEILVDQYHCLVGALDPNDDSVKAVSIRGFEWARLGVMRDGVVLLLPPDTDGFAPEHDLENIWIKPRGRYNVQSPTVSRVETVAVVATKSRDPQVVETFLDLVGMLFQTGVNADPESVRKFIENLVALFRVLTQHGHKSTQGLWGELLLIDQAVNVELAVSAWHASTNDRYDFTLGHERIEVKTATGPRIHTFAHAQLASLSGLRVSIASFVLHPSSDGCTCADMVSRILLKLPVEGLRRSFVELVVKTVGVDWRYQSRFRFDKDHALQNLRFFDVDAVPKISSPIPLNVRNVSYQSDLQVVADIGRGSLHPRDKLHLAMCGSDYK